MMARMQEFKIIFVSNGIQSNDLLTKLFFIIAVPSLQACLPSRPLLVASTLGDLAAAAITSASFASHLTLALLSL